MERLSEIIERLNRAQVEYALVGGMAVVVHGAPLVTRDIDICMPFTPSNLGRLCDALAGLHPVHRQTPQAVALDPVRDFRPDLKNLYIRCDLGVLDCLSEIKGVGDYSAVAARSIIAELPVGDCRVIDLDALIDAKTALDRTQDKLALVHLIKIKERKHS